MADISIPLYNIVVNGKDFPITLRYHHSGIKFYETEASNVATGWQIDFGGLISVTQLGRRDKDYPMVKKFDHFSENVRGDFDTLQRVSKNTLNTNEIDGEYDIYTYDFYGKSGKFIYNDEGKVIKFHYNSIDFKFGASPYYIDAYDEEGIHYRFGKSIDGNDTAFEGFGNSNTSSLLTDIELPEGQAIKYIYKESDGGTKYLPADYAKVVDYRVSFNPNVDETSIDIAAGQVSMLQYSTKIIKEIIFPYGRIVFTSDISGKRIIQIDIYNEEGLIKKINFNTTDFDGIQKRYALNSLEFKDATDNTLSKYMFEYDSGRFPTTTNTNALDYWGYYNGQTGNTSLVPNFSIPFRYNLSTTTFYRNIYSAFQGCNRNVYETPMQAYILKKITYPTGGSSNFFYEANRYGATNKLGGGLRIKQIVNNDGKGNETLKTYKYGVGRIELDPEKSENYLRVSRDFRQKRYIDGTGLATRVENYSYRIRYYGADMNSTLTLGGGNQVSYGDITEYNGTETENRGRTIYKYDASWNGYSGSNREYLFVTYLTDLSSFRGGNLIEKKVEKNNNGNWVTISKTTNEYTFIPKDIVKGLIVDKILDLPMEYYRITECNTLFPLYAGDYIDFDSFNFFKNTENALYMLYDKSLLKYHFHTISTGYNNLASTIDTLTTEAGQLTNKTDYTYGIPDYLQPTLETKQTSTGETIEKRNKYVLSPEYINTVPYSTMVQKNMISPLLEQKVYHIKNNIEELIKTDNTHFKQFYPNVIKPEKYESYYLSNINNKFTLNHDYNSKGNLVMQNRGYDVGEVYLWGYGGQYPIAKIENAYYSAVVTSLGGAQAIETFSNISNPSSADIATFIAPLKSSLPNAWISTYIYKPLVGMTSSTDPSGRTTYYEYDGFQRLRCIKDQDMNIIKTYCYNYVGQVTDCFVNTGGSIGTIPISYQNLSIRNGYPRTSGITQLVVKDLNGNIKYSFNEISLAQVNNIYPGTYNFEFTVFGDFTYSGDVNDGWGSIHVNSQWLNHHKASHPTNTSTLYIMSGVIIDQNSGCNIILDKFPI